MRKLNKRALKWAEKNSVLFIFHVNSIRFVSFGVYYTEKNNVALLLKYITFSRFKTLNILWGEKSLTIKIVHIVFEILQFLAKKKKKKRFFPPPGYRLIPISFYMRI